MSSAALSLTMAKRTKPKMRPLLSFFTGIKASTKKPKCLTACQSLELYIPPNRSLKAFFSNCLLLLTRYLLFFHLQGSQNPRKRTPKEHTHKSSPEKESNSQKNSRSRVERKYLDADDRNGIKRTVEPQSTAFKSFGTHRKSAKGFMGNLTEQHLETAKIQDASFLNVVVKVYCTHTAPDYSLPWQKQRQITSTGRHVLIPLRLYLPRVKLLLQVAFAYENAFMIGDGKLLTNAHCVEPNTQVKVKKRGDDTKYVAKVLAKGMECDIAFLSVENEKFWKGAELLQCGHLPRLQVNHFPFATTHWYPLGGDTISVTKGVVSRIEVTSYAHGSAELLGIQIDAAINPAAAQDRKQPTIAVQPTKQDPTQDPFRLRAMNQDMWWMNENHESNHYTNNSYDDEFYDNGCDYGDPYESYENDWQWTDNSIQNQYQESPYFLENQERPDEYSFDDKMDQMLDMMEKSCHLQEISLSNIQKSLEYISEQLNQQPSDNILDTTHENEVSFLSSDELYDAKVHKLTPPELEVAVEDYVSLNDKKTEKNVENEEVEIGSEKNEINMNEPIIPKVGEGLVKLNTTYSPTTLSKLDARPFIVIDFKRLMLNDFGSPFVIKKCGTKNKISHSSEEQRRSSGIHKAGRLGLYTVEEGIPFDPGGSQITYDSPSHDVYETFYPIRRGLSLLIRVPPLGASPVSFECTFQLPSHNSTAIRPAGNSGAPAFNDQGECIDVAFQVNRSDDVENIQYVIPTTVMSHFLYDYERNGKYTGIPSLGILLQKLENPALRACLKVPSNEGVLVRRVQPTSGASKVLKEVGYSYSKGTVPFRSTERIAFRYLISQKFTGDVAELGIIRAGASMKVETAMNPRVHLVPYHIEGGQPSYLIVATISQI
ncbi:hypothetical protein LXL04_032396 [Taraxacum kok-saghyz]